MFHLLLSLRSSRAGLAWASGAVTDRRAVNYDCAATRPGANAEGRLVAAPPDAPGGQSDQWLASGVAALLRRLGRLLSECSSQHDQGEDEQPDAREQQCHSDDDAEERQLLGHVAHVERRRQGGLGDPDVASAVCDRLPGLVLRRGRLVARALRVVRVSLPTGTGPSRAYVRPPDDSSACSRMTCANARDWSPVSTCSPAHCSAYFATAGSCVSPKKICSCLMLSRTVVRPSTPM